MIVRRVWPSGAVAPSNRVEAGGNPRELTIRSSNHQAALVNRGHGLEMVVSSSSMVLHMGSIRHLLSAAHDSSGLPELPDSWS